jgi:hypothetical protein
MFKRCDQLARHRIPEFSRIPACGQDCGTVRAERRVTEAIWTVKGTDQLARGRIPELCGIVSACRQNPSTVATELRLKDFILVSKGSEELA